MQGFDLTANILGLSTRNLNVLDSTDAEIWNLTTTDSPVTKPAKNVGVNATPNAQQTSKRK